MELSHAVEREELQKGIVQDNLVNLRLSGVENGEKQCPIHLIVVTDTSFSMDGPKLEAVRGALLEVIDGLTAADSFGLVSFGSEVNTLVRMMPGDEVGKSVMRTEVRRLEATGATALAGGFFEGIGRLAERLTVDAIDMGTVLLLTDGIANVGITRVNKILEVLRSMLPERARRPALHCIGIGAESQTNLLSLLADECGGGGQYWYVEEPRDVSRAIFMSLAAARAVRFRDVEVVVEPIGPVAISVTRTSQFGGACFEEVQTGEGRSAIRFDLGRIGAEQTRNVLIAVTVPPDATAAPTQPVISYSVAYRDMLQGQGQVVRRGPFTITVGRSASSSGQVNASVRGAGAGAGHATDSAVHIVNQLNRIRTSQALTRAASLGVRGRNAEAAALLEDALREVRGSVASGEDASAVFIADLELALSHLASEAEATFGPSQFSVVTDMARSHRDETASVLVQAYAGSALDAILFDDANHHDDAGDASGDQDENGATGRSALTAHSPRRVASSRRRSAIRIYRGPALVPALSQEELDRKLGRVAEVGEEARLAADGARDRSAATAATRVYVTEELRAQLALRNQRIADAGGAPADSSAADLSVDSVAADEDDNDDNDKCPDENATDELKSKLKRVRTASVPGAIDAALQEKRKAHRTANGGSSPLSEIPLAAAAGSCGSCDCSTFTANQFRPRLCAGCGHTHSKQSTLVPTENAGPRISQIPTQQNIE